MTGLAAPFLAAVVAALWIAACLACFARLKSMRPPRRTDFKMGLADAALFLCVILFSVSLPGIVLRRVPREVFGGDAGAGFAGAALSYLLMAGGYFAYSACASSKPVLARPAPFMGAGLVLRGGACMAACVPLFAALAWVWLFILFCAGADIVRQDVVEAFLAVEGAFMKAVAFVSVAALAPVAEEIVFRGVVYGALKSRCGGVCAAALSGVLFASLHFSAYAFLPLAALGVFFALLYEKFGDIRASIGAHAAFNIMNIACLWLNVF